MAENKSKLLIPGAVFVAIGIIAIVAWFAMSIAGVEMTGSGNYTSWGMFIILFMFCDGIATGSLFLGSLAILRGEADSGAARLAVLCGIVFMALTGASVVADLGQPARALNMLVFGQFGSPLMWDMLSICAAIILGIALYVASRSGNADAAKALAVIEMVLAVVVTCVMASIFGVLGAHDMWGTPLMVPWFAASALASGAAVVLLLGTVFCRAGLISFGDATKNRLGMILGIAVASDVVMLLFDVVLSVYAGSGAAYETAASQLSGALAPVFWIEVIACALAAVIGLVPRLRANGSALMGAAVLAIVGIFCKRLDIIEGGYAVSNLPYPTVQTGPYAMVDPAAGMAYAPSCIECALAVGFVLFAVGLVMLISQAAEKKAA